MTKTKKYRLKAGVWYATKQKKYKKGDVVVADVDLMARYPNKFEPIYPGAELSEAEEINPPKPPKEMVKSAKVRASEGDDEGEAGGAESPFGSDVTADFKKAANAGFCVFQDPDTQLYFVTEDNDTSTALNEDGLKTKSQVTKFVNAYTALDRTDDNDDDDIDTDEE